MIFSPSRFPIELMATLVLVQIAITFASAIPIQDSADSDDLSPIMSKEEFHQDMTRQLNLLRRAEADVMERIRSLEAQRIAAVERKRSRYTNMCLLNVVACYRKRR